MATDGGDINQSIGGPPIRGDPDPINDPEAGDGPVAPDPLPDDETDEPDTDEPEQEEPQTDEPTQEDDPDPSDDEDLDERFAREDAERIRNLDDDVVVIRIGTRGGFPEYLVQAPSGESAEISGDDPVATARAFLESQEPDVSDGGGTPTQGGSTTDPQPQPEPEPGPEPEPEPQRDTGAQPTQGGGGSEPQIGADPQPEQEPDPNVQEEQFGDISITNPITGNRIEDDLARASEVFQESVGDASRAAAVTPTSLFLSQQAGESPEQFLEPDSTGERAREAFPRGTLTQFDPFATAGAVKEAGELAVFGAGEIGAGRGQEFAEDFGTAALETGQQLVAEGVESFRERPVETAAFGVGSLVGTAAAFKGARAVGPRTRLATGAVVQPGEEILERAGGRLVGRPGQPFGSEEIALAAGRRVVSRFDPGPAGSPSGRVGAGLVPKAEGPEAELEEELERMERASRGEFQPGGDRQVPNEPSPERINRPRGGPSRRFNPRGGDVELRQPDTDLRDLDALETRLRQSDVDEMLDTETESDFFRDTRFESDGLTELGPTDSAGQAAGARSVVLPRAGQVQTEAARPDVTADVAQRPDVDTDLDSDVDTDIRTDVETDVRTRTDTRTDLDTRVDTDTDLDTDTDTDTDFEFEFESEQETESETEFEFESETEFEAESALFERDDDDKERFGFGSDEFEKEFTTPVTTPEEVLSGTTGLVDDDS